MDANKARWKNGKRMVAGCWMYVWAADRFVIVLDQVDRTTGEQRRVTVAGDEPEWGNWKLVREEKEGRDGCTIAEQSGQ